MNDTGCKIVGSSLGALELLTAYYGAQRKVAFFMDMAMESFELGQEQESFLHLFNWCETKDARRDLWDKFKQKYPLALMLKEGRQ